MLWGLCKLCVSTMVALATAWALSSEYDCVSLLFISGCRTPAVQLGWQRYSPLINTAGAPVVRILISTLRFFTLKKQHLTNLLCFRMCTFLSPSPLLCIYYLMFHWTLSFCLFLSEQTRQKLAQIIVPVLPLSWRRFCPMWRCFYLLIIILLILLIVFYWLIILFRIIYTLLV